MNSAIYSKRWNTIFFYWALFFSIVLFATAAYTFKVFLSGNADNVPNHISLCTSIFNTHGFNLKAVAGSAGHWSTTKAATGNTEDLITQVGLLMTYCPAYEIKSFCAGSACSVPGLEMTIGPR